MATAPVSDDVDYIDLDSPLLLGHLVLNRLKAEDANGRMEVFTIEAVVKLLQCENLRVDDGDASIYLVQCTDDIHL